MTETGLCEAHPSITSRPGDVCRCQPITGLQSRLTHLSQSASPTQTHTWQHYNIDILLLHIAKAGQVFSLLYMCNKIPSRWGNKMGKRNKVYDAASADENDKRLGKLCWYAWMCRYVYITYLISDYCRSILAYWPVLTRGIQQCSLHTVGVSECSVGLHGTRAVVCLEYIATYLERTLHVGCIYPSTALIII